MAASGATGKKRAAAKRPASKRPARRPRASAQEGLLEQLERIERDGGDGQLEFPDGVSLRVSSLGKPYFPEAGVTKGDLMRYYVRVAPMMLPHLEGRPIALKRYPDGVTGHSFYQQNVPEHAPAFVRRAEVPLEDGSTAERLVGGDLPTLLYCVQTGAIAVHTWMSRAGSLEHPDFSLIDLDPADDAPFTRAVELAQLITKELDRAGLAAALKTSGASGIHIGIPLPRRASWQQSVDVASRIAERVVAARPDIATMERRIEKRPAGSVYVDVQQNAMGKSVVAPYAVRAKARATVSCPLRRNELRATLDLQAHTVGTVPRRLERVGDLWGEALADGNAARTITALLRDREGTTPKAASGAERSIRGSRGRHGAR